MKKSELRKMIKEEVGKLDEQLVSKDDTKKIDTYIKRKQDEIVDFIMNTLIFNNSKKFEDKVKYYFKDIFKGEAFDDKKEQELTQYFFTSLLSILSK